MTLLVEKLVNSIMVFVEGAEKYTPQLLGIAFDQIKALLTAENGEPVGATSFKLISNPKPFQKNWLYGAAYAAWHTKGSIISVHLRVGGAVSEETPSSGSVLFVTKKYVGCRTRYSAA